MSEQPELTLKQILFGGSERDGPDQIDLLVYRAMAAAGPRGTTMIEVAQRLLERQLTKEEENLVILADEMEARDMRLPPTLVEHLDDT